jgi:hypothetical protein
MSMAAGIERPYNLLQPSAVSALDGVVDLVPPSTVAITATNGPAVAGAQVTGATVPTPALITAAFTLVTATIYAMGVLLPKNVPVSQVGSFPTAAGTTTGYWYALADNGLVVRAVSANQGAGPASTNTYLRLSVTPSGNLAYVTAYAGLYYLCLGVVTSAAGTQGATAAAVNAAVNAGPPVIVGTSATAATTTPPAVGTVLGALTGTTGGTLYMDVV